MDKQILARIFVLLSYMIGAWGLPVYLIFQYCLWLAEINRIVYILNSIPLGILLGFWFWISIGIFGYSIGEE